jgi:hypothetical protein
MKASSQKIKSQQEFYLEQKKTRLDGESLKPFLNTSGVDPYVQRRNVALHQQLLIQDP